MQIFYSLGYKGFISAVNTQVGGLLSKFLASASQNVNISSSLTSGYTNVPELSRRKTEPILQLNRPTLIHHDSMPCSSTALSTDIPRKVSQSSNGRAAQANAVVADSGRRQSKVDQTEIPNESPSDIDNSGTSISSNGIDGVNQDVSQVDEASQNQSSCVIV